MDRKQSFSLWYVVLVFVALLTLQDFIGSGVHNQNLSYSEFKQALTAGKVKDVVLKEGMASGGLQAEGLEQILPPQLVETLKKKGGEHRFDTVLVNDPNVRLAPEVDLGSIAARTPGFAGADLANLVNEATLRAAKHGKDAVDTHDFEEALDRIVAGL